MSSLEELERRVEKIEERNRRVELDKSWETSLLRRLIIMIVTYLLLGMYMTFLGVNAPWKNAVVPTVGFLLSTLTIQAAKNIWMYRHSR